MGVYRVRFSRFGKWISRSNSRPTRPVPRMRWAALPILAGSFSLPARTRCSNANNCGSAVAISSAVRWVSRQARASDSTTTVRVPSSRVTSAAPLQPCSGISTHTVFWSTAAKAWAVTESRRSLVANR